MSTRKERETYVAKERERGTAESRKLRHNTTQYRHEIDDDNNKMDFGDWTDHSQIAAGLWRNNPRGRKDLQNFYGETGKVYSVDLTPFESSSSSSSYAARMGASSNAVFVGLVVACLCVSFVLVFSVVAAVKVSSSSSSSGGEGGGREEEEERERLVGGGGEESSRMRRKKTKKRSDESSSSLYGAIV